MTSSQFVVIIKREENETLQVTEATCYVKQAGSFLPVKSLVYECLSTVSARTHAPLHGEILSPQESARVYVTSY